MKKGALQNKDLQRALFVYDFADDSRLKKYLYPR